MTNCEAWDIDPATILRRYPDGRFTLEWCKAEGEPVARLDELAEGTLLAECESAIARPADRTEKRVTVDNEFGDGFTFTLEREAAADAEEYRRSERTRGPGAR